MSIMDIPSTDGPRRPSSHPMERTVKDNTMMIPVPFGSDTVWAVDQEGQVLVAMKPIVENLGLAWNGQHKRITKTAVLAKGISVMEIPSPGGTQKTLCLPLKLLPGWLFSIDSARVKPEIRDKIEAYQAECYEVLWQYFRGEVSTPRPGQQPASVDVHNGIESSLHPHQLRLLAAVKAHGHISHFDVFEATGLSRHSNERALHLLWYLGVVEAYDEGAGLRLRVVPTERRPGLPMPILRRPTALPSRRRRPLSA